MRTDWTLQKVWNEALDQQEKRPYAPRDYLWASELGRSDIDVYLKMLGTEPTNEPNARSKRKFEAGNIWEWILSLILRRCGIFIDSQEYMKNSIDAECVPVSGKLDFIAGGKVNYEQAEALIGELHLPDMFTRAIRNMLSYFREKYPEGLGEKIIEAKSVSSFAFDKVEMYGKPLAGHDLQLYHYLRAKKMDGALVYICRDDARMIEMFISHEDPRLEAEYERKVRRMSNFYRNKIRPEIEKEILFDDDELRFTKNFNVEYSPFLTMLYKHEQPADYDDKVSPVVARWNRVLGRIKEGKEMTDNNSEALAEMAEAGWDIEFIKAKITESKS